MRGFYQDELIYFKRDFTPTDMGTKKDSFENQFSVLILGIGYRFRVRRFLYKIFEYFWIKCMGEFNDSTNYDSKNL